MPKLDDLPNGKFRAGEVYAAMAQRGIPPSEVKKLSLSEIFEIFDCFARQGQGNEGARLTSAEADEIFAWLEPASAMSEIPIKTYTFFDGVLSCRQ